jgi:sarcosine oxidase subunit gamma
MKRSLCTSRPRNSTIRLERGSMTEAFVRRQGPLDLLAGPRGTGAAVELSVARPRAKFSLRCRPETAATAGRTFGIALPDKACTAAVAGDRAALWLGPDEWLLLAAEHDAEAIAGQTAAALGGRHYSLVDVSHRSCGFATQGPHAATLINHGCPLDLSLASFPVGACTRTLFEKAEIILWRVEEHTYHVEIERSFAPYVWNMLIDAREEFA